MKAILISDHAKWCALMMNGQKKSEVRKGTALYKATQKLIDEYGFAEFYVYCTKDEKEGLVWDNDGKGLVNAKLFPYSKSSPEQNRLVNGKVLFKFRCYKVEHFEREYLSRYIDDYYYDNGEPLNKKFYNHSCLSEKELIDYIGSGSGCDIHISDLEIFDEPKDLSEFRHYKRFDCYNADFDYTTIEYRKIELTKAPQSWCYVEL